MTEVIDAPQALTAADLLRPPQEMIVFPNSLLQDSRWLQLPPGNVVYIDAKDPNTIPQSVTMLDKKGHPVQSHGHNLVKDFSAPQRVPAAIVHTGPRTPEESYNQVIAEATQMLTRKNRRDSLGRITEQYLGFVVVVEDKKDGGDNRKGWREDQFSNLGAVKGRGENEQIVIETDNQILSFGRVKKVHGRTDMSKGYQYQQAQESLNKAEGQGLQVNRGDLKLDAQASPFVPRTKENLSDLNGIRITDPLTGCTVERTTRGITISHHVCENPEEHDIPLPQTKVDVKRLLIDQYKKGGLKKIELDQSCGDCGQHLKYEYYPNNWIKKDETIQLLKRRTVCDSKLHRGMPGTITIGEPTTIGLLSSHKNH